MNRYILAAIVGILGLGGGATAAHYLTKAQMQKLLDETEKEMADLRDAYEEKLSESQAMWKDELATAMNTPKDKVETRVVTVSECQACVKKRKRLEEVAAYHNEHVGPYIPEDELASDEELEEEEEDEEMVNHFPDLSQEKFVDPDRDEPYLINEETFRYNERDYTQDSMMYFVKDDILVDDMEEVVENVEGLVGDACTNFDENGDIYNLFVRNNRLRLELELVMDTNDYIDSDIVPSYTEPEEKIRKFRDED